MMLTHTLRCAALAACLALAGGGASAADFTFTGSTDSGPLASQAFSGSFSFDGAVAAADGDLALTAFSLSFAGQTWTLAALDAGAVAVFSTGTPLGLALAAASGDLGQRPAIEFVPGFTELGGAYLAYRGLDGQGEALGFGSYTLTDVTPAVPEPGTYALLLAGLAGVGLLARRQRRS